MSFHEELQAATADARAQLFDAPIIRDCLAGRVTLAQYHAFLAEAYHHVKHTVPLMMACGSRLSREQGWLRSPIADYIRDEIGHEEWILDDIRRSAGDADAVRDGRPGVATELMVAYVYDYIARVNPVGFFGMVQVLEGTSVALATNAARRIREALSLASDASMYLDSHGSLDRQHVEFFAALMNRVQQRADRDAIVHVANVVYRLYRDIFLALPRYEARARGEAAR
jgi:hypothetical protein